MKTLPLFIFLFYFTFVYNTNAQTSEYGNLEIYDRETSYSAFAYFSGSFPLSNYLGDERIELDGMCYSNVYDIARISSLVPTSQLTINFMLKGVFKIGAGFGTKNIENFDGLYPKSDIKYYLLNLDLFTLSFQPEITYIFNEGYAVTVFCGIDFINAGGNLAVLEEGNLGKHTIGVINAAPLGFRPGGYFDFGRSALGFSFYINSINFFEYRIISKDLYPGISGIQSSEAFVRRFEFQLIYTF